MKRYTAFVGVTIAGLISVMPFPGIAQDAERQGTLQLDMINVMIDESEAILSNGVLDGLETDPNFTGDLAALTDVADSLLEHHTPVTRGGHFPENAGIPLAQQLTLDECVYRLFNLDNGNELMLYQSPQDRDVQYLIRGVN